MDISEEARYVFDMHHIIHVWTQLRKIGFNTEELAADFHLAYGRAKEKESLLPESTFFLRWGIDVLQLRMNARLGRQPHHPTFIRMMEFLMEPVIRSDHAAQEIRRRRQNGKINESKLKQ